MYKTILRKSPWLWEQLQAARDWRVHQRQNRNGSYSQHGEDVVLLRLLEQLNARGPYVDIGCNHPFKLSNTYLLYRNGWRGLCVDPLPRFSKLYKRWRPDDDFRCVAIGETPAVLPLFEFDWDPLSTLDGELAASYQRIGHKLRRKSQVEVRPINALLEESALLPPLSLLSVDIEGREVSALRSIDLDKWRPAIVCLEVLTADGARNEEAVSHLTARGYEVCSDLGLNILFKRANSSSAAD